MNSEEIAITIKTKKHLYNVLSKSSSLEILEILEKMLKESSLKSSGLNSLTLPDRGWLQNCILTLDPSDPYKILDFKPDSKQTFIYKINEE